MPAALQDFLDSIAAGDDTRSEKAALALGQLGDAALGPLRDLLAEADPDRRWWAARALASLGTPAAQALLIPALEDAHPDVRACAAQGLGELRATQGLGELRAAQAVPALVRCMGERGAFVSRIAADALAHIGPPAVPALIAALREGSTAARVGAARALGIIQPQEAVPVLCAALGDPSAAVTHYAEEALERMGVGIVLFRP